MSDVLFLHRLAEAALILLYAMAAALAARFLVTRAIVRLVARTKTDLDNVIVNTLRGPVFWTLLLGGLVWGWRVYTNMAPGELTVMGRIALTLAVFFWTGALMRISEAILEAFSRQADKHAWINPRSLPLLEIAVKLGLLGAAVYVGMKAWSIDVTAWVASAGIVGLAVGFAAKDTLANLFAGIFILADAPYQIGDFIVLDTGERGRVTDIGIRSTRIITRDDIEITLPNAAIANAKISNETGGPSKRKRVSVVVGVAYGSDIDRVREVLLDVARQVDLVEQNPEPQVRFREMGDSALVFHVRGWVKEPVLVGRAIDELNTGIYKRLATENIEIPFPQRVVHHRQPTPED